MSVDVVTYEDLYALCDCLEKGFTRWAEAIDGDPTSEQLADLINRVSMGFSGYYAMIEERYMHVTGAAAAGRTRRRAVKAALAKPKKVVERAQRNFCNGLAAMWGAAPAMDEVRTCFAAAVAAYRRAEDHPTQDTGADQPSDHRAALLSRQIPA